MSALCDAPDLTQAAADVIRPLEALSPSEFAERHIELDELETSQPGPWSNEVFPYLVQIMDAVQEAIETGRNLVLIKSGQGGGSRAMINAWAWLKIYYPGPSLYLISKDEHAREFGRERFGPMNETCAPLKRIALSGRGEGELVHIKRYTTGKHVIVGGRSVLNLETQPYRVVLIDEYDSLMDEIPGKGDPLANAEIRTDAFPGPTIIIAFAHPTTDERGAGELYYKRSDQRRAFAACFHCGEEIWLQWDHVQVIPEGGETFEQARRNPYRYTYVTPCCGAVLEDYQRYEMARSTQQKSTLDPKDAATKEWIGVHFSQLYMSNKPLVFLARKWIEGIDDPGIRRVTVNKRFGDVWREQRRKTNLSDWRALIVKPRFQDDPEAYNLGEVPPGVSFLTAGQDSRAAELHWAVWGWGLVANQANYPLLCAWLIDYGLVPLEVDPEREASIEAEDLAPLEQLLYERGFPRVGGEDESLYVRHGYHDSGWFPVPVAQFCAGVAGARAIPSRGGNVDSSNADKIPVHCWGAAPTWRINGEEVKDPSLKVAMLNTYRLKEQWTGMVSKRFDRPDDQGPMTRITLPRGVEEQFLAQSSSEYLAREKKKWAWKHKGPNHWSDCNVQAFGAALNLNPFLKGETREQHVAKAIKRAEEARHQRRRRRKGSSWIDRELEAR